MPGPLDSPNSGVDSEQHDQEEEHDPFADILDQLEAVRQIDPQLHARLKEDLKQVDEPLQMAMIRSVRARLAYHEQPDQPVRPANSHNKGSLSANAHNTSPRAAELPDLSDNPLRRVGHESSQNSLSDRADAPGANPVSSSADRWPKDAPQPPSRHARSYVARTSGTKTHDPPTMIAMVEQADGGLRSDTSDAEQASWSADRAAPATAWTHHVESAIRALEAELDSEDASRDIQTDDHRKTTMERKAACLRMLYLMSGRYQDAIQGLARPNQPAISQIVAKHTGVSDQNPDRKTPADRFWTDLMHGLATYMDEEGTPVADRRADQSLRELRSALGHLSDLSTLHVGNLAFCREVDGYGRYTRFDEYEFDPEEEVLLYVEVDNFTSVEVSEGYTTSLEGSYRIFDASGARVAEHTFPRDEEICRNRRRDYFIPYFMWMPKRITPGQYRLQLTIEDIKGRKFGQSSIEFRIKRP